MPARSRSRRRGRAQQQDCSGDSQADTDSQAGTSPGGAADGHDREAEVHYGLRSETATLAQRAAVEAAFAAAVARDAEDASPCNASQADASLPEPTPHMLGRERRMWPVEWGGKWERGVHCAGNWPEKKSEQGGNERFIRCNKGSCGWLVHLNTACKAHKSKRGRVPDEGPDASLACTNYECTGKSSHRRYQERYKKKQRERARAIRDGSALLVVITGHTAL
jgi:hypothetical protein